MLCLNHENCLFYWPFIPHNKVPLHNAGLRKNHLLSLRLDLRDSLKRLNRLDQEYRINQNNIPNTQRTSLGIKRDSLVQDRLWNLFQENGYFSIDLIGGFDVDNQPVSPLLIMMHTPTIERFEKWFPYLKQQVQLGKCSPEFLGFNIDQHCMYHNQSPKIGIMSKRVENEIETDSLRAIIGLPSFRISYEIKKLKRERRGFSQ